MTYEESENGVPESIRGDPVWPFYAYRKTLFLFDLAWTDCEKLLHDPRGRAVAGQLIEAVGSVSANIEEGYGRGFGKDRNHFLRISAGSARETKGWYFRSHQILSPEVIRHRMALCDDVIALLITELKIQRISR